MLYPDFDPLWHPVATYVPGHALFLYLGPLISLTAGVGLLVRQVAVIAARVLLATLFFWVLIFRLPDFVYQPAFQACWSVVPALVMLAATLIIHVRLMTDYDQTHPGFIGRRNGLRAARLLYGVCLIFFGIAHFVDVKDTITLIPHWLPAHLFWAYFTGCTFIAAALADLVDVCAQLAITLSAVQIALFLIVIWIPILAAGPNTPFKWSETILTAALMAGALVVASSYHGDEFFAQPRARLRTHHRPDAPRKCV